MTSFKNSCGDPYLPKPPGSFAAKIVPHLSYQESGLLRILLHKLHFDWTLRKIQFIALEVKDEALTFCDIFLAVNGKNMKRHTTCTLKNDRK